MTRRQTRIGRFVLALAFAGLGIFAFIKADYFFGAFYVFISAAFVLMALFADRLTARRPRERDGPSY